MYFSVLCSGTSIKCKISTLSGAIIWTGIIDDLLFFSFGCRILNKINKSLFNNIYIFTYIVTSTGKFSLGTSFRFWFRGTLQS